MRFRILNYFWILYIDWAEWLIQLFFSSFLFLGKFHLSIVVHPSYKQATIVKWFEGKCQIFNQATAKKNELTHINNWKSLRQRVKKIYMKIETGCEQMNSFEFGLINWANLHLVWIFVCLFLLCFATLFTYIIDYLWMCELSCRWNQYGCNYVHVQLYIYVLHACIAFAQHSSRAL